MDSLNQLLPKDKGDITSPIRLFGRSYAEERPIVPELLNWLQDGHWEASQPVGQYLSTIAEELTDEIITILRSNDGAWKYQVLRWLVADRPIAPEIESELVRLRDSPEGDDTVEDVQDLARRLLRRDGG
jgi:hypothetical protein